MLWRNDTVPTLHFGNTLFWPIARTVGSLAKVSDLVYQGLISTSQDPRLLPALEPYISSVAAGRPLQLKFLGSDVGVNKDTPHYYTFPKDQMTNCAQVYGSGKYKHVFMRGLNISNIPAYSTLTGRGLLNSSEAFVTAFNRTAPLNRPQSTNTSRLYADEFSHYVDFAPYPDTWPFLPLPGDAKIFNGFLPVDAGSCGRDRQVRLGYHTLLTDRIDRSYAYPNARSVFLDSDDVESYDGVVALHEFGHMFAKLNDEYVEADKLPNPLLQKVLARAFMIGGFLKHNCSYDPASDFYFGGKLYGGLQVGSGIMLATGFQGCAHVNTVDSKPIYRPSLFSLMGDHQISQEFNVVSCGYILKAITKGSNAKSFWPECSAMPGIVSVGQ